jgi:tRNA(fMet)-specific endonuclease VapC
MTVADTDVLIDFLKGKGEADAVEKLLRHGLLRTTTISRFELLSGAKTSKQASRVLRLLEAIPAMELDSQGADAASEIRKDLEGKGETIGMADSLIAGIVMSRRGALLTRNRRHFERVPGLRLV